MRIGYATGPETGIWRPVAASLKVHPFGGFWCYLDSNGRVSLSLDATANIFGWAKFPRAFRSGSTDETNGYWTSHGTLYDRVWVWTNPNTKFWMPVSSGTQANVTDARLGELMDITGVNSADGSKQEANVGTNSTDVLVVSDVNLDDTTIIQCRMNESKMQKDT